MRLIFTEFASSNAFAFSRVLNTTTKKKRIESVRRIRRKKNERRKGEKKNVTWKRAEY